MFRPCVELDSCRSLRRKRFFIPHSGHAARTHRQGLHIYPGAQGSSCLSEAHFSPPPPSQPKPSDSRLWCSQVSLPGASEGLWGSEHPILRPQVVLEARKKVLIIKGPLSQSLLGLPMPPLPPQNPRASSCVLSFSSGPPQPFLVSILASWPPHPLGFWENQRGMEQWPKIRTHNRSREG